MNGVQTRFKCKLDVKRCKRFVFPPSSLLPRSNALKTKAIRYFQTDRTLTRIVSPPLYLRDEVSSVTTYTKVLRGFERISLEAGEEQMVHFRLRPQDLGLWDKNMNFRVEPGKFKVMIGSSSTDIRLHGRFEIAP